MSGNPPIVQNTVGYNPTTDPRVPTTTQAGATWRGVPPWSSVPYPILPGLLWQAKHQGRFSLIEAVPQSDPRFARGPRFSPKRGSVDAWVSAPAAGSARSFLQFGEVGVTTSTAVITLGVDNANKVTVTMRDKNGATVVAAAAATLAALVVSVQAHIKFTWDAREGTASLTVDGAATPPGDFSVDPNGTPWDAGVPVEANLDRESWTGSIHLVQVGNV